MLISTLGIVFRATKYSETSFITNIYTAQKGLQSFIISGVRKAKAKTGAGLFQPGTLLDLVAYYRDDKQVHRIKEVKLAYPFREIPFKIQKTAVSVFMAELCSKTVQEAEGNPALFEFLWNSFIYLDKTDKPIANLPNSFMCNLTSFLGFFPQITSLKAPVFDLKDGIFCESPTEMNWAKDGPTVPILKHFFQHNLSDAHQITCTRPQRKEILETLTKYYGFHISGFSPLNSPVIYGNIF